MDNKIIKQIVDESNNTTTYDIGVKWDNIELPNGSSLSSVHQLPTNLIATDDSHQFMTKEDKDKISIITEDKKISASNVQETESKKFMTQEDKDKISIINTDKKISANDVQETESRKFMTKEDKDKMSAINGNNQISANKIETSTTQQFVSQTEKNIWNGKQDEINKDNKLSADLIKTDNSHQFMTQNDKERLDNILKDGKINHHIDADKVDTNENYQFITGAEKNSLNNLNDFYNKEHNNLERVANRSSSLIIKENIDTKYPTVKAVREYVQDIVGQYSNSWDISWEQNKKFITFTQDNKEFIKKEKITGTPYYYVGEVSLEKTDYTLDEIKASTFLQKNTIDIAFVVSTQRITDNLIEINNNNIKYYRGPILDINRKDNSSLANYKYLYIIAQGEKINDDNYLKPSENPNIRVAIKFAILINGQEGQPATYSYSSVVCKSKISPNRISEDNNKQFVSQTEKDIWNGKQDNINENNKLSADLINQTTNLRFVTDNEKDKIAEAYRATQDDFYTKEQTYDRDAINQAIQRSVASVYVYKGSVENLDELERVPEPRRVGDVYNVGQLNNSNYAWNGTSWDNLGNDLSSYELKSDKITNLIDSAITSDELKSPTTKAVKDYIIYNNVREYLNWTNKKYLKYNSSENEKDYFSISSTSSGLYVSDPIPLEPNEIVKIQTYLGTDFLNLLTPYFAIITSKKVDINNSNDNGEIVDSNKEVDIKTDRWGIYNYNNKTANTLYIYVGASQTLASQTNPAIKPQNNPDITIQILNQSNRIKRIYNSSEIKANRVAQDDNNYQFVSKEEKEKWNSILNENGKLAKNIPVNLIETNQQNNFVSQDQINNWNEKQDAIGEIKDNKIVTVSAQFINEDNNKQFVSQEQKDEWNNKYIKPEEGIPFDDLNTKMFNKTFYYPVASYAEGSNINTFSISLTENFKFTIKDLVQQGFKHININNKTIDDIFDDIKEICSINVEFEDNEDKTKINWFQKIIENEESNKKEYISNLGFILDNISYTFQISETPSFISQNNESVNEKQPVRITLQIRTKKNAIGNLSNEITFDNDNVSKNKEFHFSLLDILFRNYISNLSLLDTTEENSYFEYRLRLRRNKDYQQYRFGCIKVSNNYDLPESTNTLLTLNKDISNINQSLITKIDNTQLNERLGTIKKEKIIYEEKNEQGIEGLSNKRFYITNNNLLLPLQDGHLYTIKLKLIDSNPNDSSHTFSIKHTQLATSPSENTALQTLIENKQCNNYINNEFSFEYLKTCNSIGLFIQFSHNVTNISYLQISEMVDAPLDTKLPDYCNNKDSIEYFPKHKIDELPDYCLGEIDRVKQEIFKIQEDIKKEKQKEKYKNDDNFTDYAAIFGIYTDIHFGEKNTNTTDEAQKWNSIKSLKRIADECNLDFVLQGGDLVDGNTYKNDIEVLYRSQSLFDNCKVPLYTSKGDHDISQNTHSGKGVCLDIKDFARRTNLYMPNAIYSNTHPSNYYFDLLDKQIRVVNIDTGSLMSGEAAWDAQDLYTWLLNDVFTNDIKDNWRIIVFSHAPCDLEWNAGNAKRLRMDQLNKMYENLKTEVQNRDSLSEDKFKYITRLGDNTYQLNKTKFAEKITDLYKSSLNIIKRYLIYLNTLFTKINNQEIFQIDENSNTQQIYQFGYDENKHKLSTLTALSRNTIIDTEENNDDLIRRCLNVENLNNINFSTFEKFKEQISQLYDPYENIYVMSPILKQKGQNNIPFNNFTKDFSNWTSKVRLILGGHCHCDRLNMSTLMLNEQENKYNRGNTNYAIAYTGSASKGGFKDDKTYYNICFGDSATIESGIITDFGAEGPDNVSWSHIKNRYYGNISEDLMDVWIISDYYIKRIRFGAGRGSELLPKEVTLVQENDD